MESSLSQYFSEIGRKGGKARMKTMTPAQRREIAKKAAKAAVAARAKKAKKNPK